jgi:hypothetical protein
LQAKQSGRFYGIIVHERIRLILSKVFFFGLEDTTHDHIDATTTSRFDRLHIGTIGNAGTYSVGKYSGNNANNKQE